MLQRKIPNFDHGVNGTSIGRCGTVLDALAKEAGVRPLMEFLVRVLIELIGFAEGQGVDLREKTLTLPAEPWFSAEDGLRTVRALMLAVDNGKIEHLDKVMADLKEFHDVLEVARKHDVGWHLAVDF